MAGLARLLTKSTAGIIPSTSRPGGLLLHHFNKNVPLLQSLSSANVEQKKPFDKILIANRGEIACRVIKTCRRLGIETVAVYSEADEHAVHVRMADEAVLIGPAPTNESYLRMDKVIDACKATGAQAVHPGYGFLSENYHFSEKLGENNIVFIGPSNYSLQVMGDKIESKRIGKKAKVNLIPGFDGVVETDAKAVEIANEIGYPVMIKASAGGGGKGMRIAYNDQEVREGFRFSSQEAKSSFGDDRLLVEKFIEHPRHIEIQVIGDKHGNVLYLNERECSIQRRNQKVIEEAPSPFLDPETRSAMGEQAVMLAKDVGYSSAGTVEFLVDKNKNFYFLEMNTRLQVEHPITELITGVDLVELMLRSAAGEELQLKQNDIGINGWAFECRVYAEDPYKNFGMPSVGTLTRYIEPLHIPDVRCDSGVREGSEISIYYDSMICKLVSHGNTREEALQTIRKALDSYVIKGVRHNISLLRDVADHEKFITGDISTNFLKEEYPDGFSGKKLTENEDRELATAACHAFIQREHIAGQFANHDKYLAQRKDLKEWNLVATYDDKEFKCQLNYCDGEIKGWVNDTPIKFLCSSSPSSAIMDCVMNDKHLVLQLIGRTGQKFSLQHLGTIFDVSVYTVEQDALLKIMPEKPKEDSGPYLLSPMVGKVLSVSCKAGDKVVEGQEVAVIEAMKMQNCITAHKTGIVEEVHCVTGEQVEEDKVMLMIK